MNWYFEVLQNYAMFNGRARRAEYWMFTFINAFVYIALLVAGAIMDMGHYNGSAGAVLVSLYSLVIVIPTLAVTVRRLHDVGRSGWWILFNLVPVVGGHRPNRVHYDRQRAGQRLRPESQGHSRLIDR